MFTYFKLKKTLEKMKLKDFNDFVHLLQKKEALEKENIELESKTLKSLADLKSIYEREISCLKLSHTLNEEEMKLKYSNEIKSLNHVLVLTKEKMELEKKSIIQEATANAREIVAEAIEKTHKERSEMLEKNYGDLKNSASNQFNQTKQMIEVVSSVMPTYRNENREGSHPPALDVNINKD